MNVSRFSMLQDFLSQYLVFCRFHRQFARSQEVFKKLIVQRFSISNRIYEYFLAAHFCSDSISLARNSTSGTWSSTSTCSCTSELATVLELMTCAVIFQTKCDDICKKIINLNIHSEAARCYMGYLIYI